VDSSLGTVRKGGYLVDKQVNFYRKNIEKEKSLW
jgi:hypothetical protein